jgi:hypothetical protein
VKTARHIRNPAAISPAYENIPQKPQKTCAKTAYPLDKKHIPCDYNTTASKAAQNLSVNRIFFKMARCVFAGVNIFMGFKRPPPPQLS